MHGLSIEESIGPLNTIVFKAENHVHKVTELARTLHVLEVTSGSSMVRT